MKKILVSIAVAASAVVIARSGQVADSFSDYRRSRVRKANFRKVANDPTIMDHTKDSKPNFREVYTAGAIASVAESRNSNLSLFSDAIGQATTPDRTRWLGGQSLSDIGSPANKLALSQILEGKVSAADLTGSSSYRQLYNQRVGEANAVLKSFILPKVDLKKRPPSA